MKNRGFPHETLSEERGFTLVEALVVLIIGILAIPVFLGQRGQTKRG